MSLKRLCSSLGVGLAFVAVLSMVAMPALVAAEEREYVQYWYYCRHLTWHVGVGVGGWLDDNGLLTNITWDQDLWNAVRTGGSVSYTSTKIIMSVNAQSWLGDNVCVSAWISSDGSHGGSVVYL